MLQALMQPSEQVLAALQTREQRVTRCDGRSSAFFFLRVALPNLPRRVFPSAGEHADIN